MTLIIHTANLGDVVSAVGVMKGLARQAPVEVLLRKSFRGLLEGEQNIQEIDENQLRPFYDRVIDLDSSKVSRQILGKVRSPQKIGRSLNWLRKLKYSRIYSQQVPKHSMDHIVWDYSPVAELMGLDVQIKPHLNRLPLSEDLKSWLQGIGFLEGQGQPLTLVHGEASNLIRSLPEEFVLSLVTELTKQNKKVLLIGEPSAYLTRVLEQCRDQAFHRSFSIAELKAIMPLAQAFIGPDSGPLHLAASLGVQCTGIYGPTLSRQYSPISDHLQVVEQEFSCRPCNQNRPCPYQRRCLSYPGSFWENSHLL